MSSAAEQQILPGAALVTMTRRFAAVVPAILIAYSVIVDPLINLQPVSGTIGGPRTSDVGKSTLLAQLLIPALFVTLGFLATIAPPRGLRGLVPILVPLGAFLGLALASAAWSAVPNRTLVLAIYQILLCTLLTLSVAISGDPDRIFRTIFWVFAVAVAINLLFVLARPPGPIGHQGIYPYKNTLGSAMACAILIALPQIAGNRGFLRFCALATVLCGTVVLLASESKTAIGLVVVAPVAAMTILFLSTRLRLSPASIIIGLLIFAAPALILATQLARVSLSDLLTLTLGDTTFTGRTVIWSFVSSHIEQAPVLGHGYRGFWGIGDLSPKLHSEIEFIRVTGSSHNGFVDITLDLGFAGLTLLLILVATTVSLCSRAIDGRGTAFLLLSIVLFVIGRNTMESVILWSTFFDNLLFILAGISACYLLGTGRRAAPDGQPIMTGAR